MVQRGHTRPGLVLPACQQVEQIGGTYRTKWEQPRDGRSPRKVMPLRTWFESIIQDLRYAVRGFRRSPGPFWIAVITVALGAGGATAVFSVVDRILFRNLPYAHQDRLMWFGMKAPINQSEFLLEGDFQRFREHSQVFESMGAIGRVSDCDLNEQDSLRLACAQVTAGFLPTLGLAPHIGRNFTPEED